MPVFVVNKATRLLNNSQKAVNGAKILLLGISYKSNISDHRESPAITIFKLLQKFGAQVSYHDAYVTSFELSGEEYYSVDLSDDVLKEMDLIIVTTAHNSVDYQRVVDHANLVLDTRCATRNIQADNVVLL
jgi:UDP-N-acetyl-D-glucosamine dehydrogenase